MVCEENFLKRHADTFVLSLRLADIIGVGTSGIVSCYIVFKDFFLIQAFYSNFFIVLFLTAFLFERFHLYRPWRGAKLRSELWQLSLAWLTTLGIAFLVSTILSIELFLEHTREWMLLWVVIGWGWLSISRVLLRRTLALIRTRGLNLKCVVLVGVSSIGVEVAHHINRLAWIGYRVLGYVDDRTKPRIDTKRLRHLGSTNDLVELVQKHGLDEVWICYPFRGEARVKEVLHILRHSSVTIRFVVDVYAFEMLQHSATEIAGVPMINIHASPLHEGLNRFVKEIEDRVLAFVSLLLLSPLMLAIVIGVKLSSPGPVFYRQERVSWNNKLFVMLKFRSMPVDAEKHSGPVWAKPEENRATRFGAFLRKTSLDELPQLINVLKGEMSIVGPRPERPHFIESFKDEIPLYMKKHMVKAGITGWAQVNGWRGDSDIKKRIEYDLYYVRNWSLWFDLHIALKTIFAGLINRNAY